MSISQIEVIQRSLVAIKTLMDNGQAELSQVEKTSAMGMISGLMEYVDWLISDSSANAN